MEIKIEARNKTQRKFIQALLPSMMEQLALAKSTLAMLIIVEKNEQSDGTTLHIAPLNSVVVTINPGSLKEMGLSLAHEMVHVKQIASGVLKTVRGINYWCGRKYHKNTPYLNSPWELQAFAKQEIIFRRALEA